jgi:hypothetical protein
MNQLQEQKLTRYIAFREFLSQNPLTLEQHPHLKPHYQTFLTHLNLILKTLEIMEENLKTSENYSEIKEELIKVALSVSRKVTAYALLEELTDVQGLFCYTEEELTQDTDEKLLKNCKGILNFISNYRAELKEYGVDKVLENKLRDLTDQFLLIYENKKISHDITIQSTDQFNYLINAADEILESKLLLLSESISSKPS